MDALVLLLVPVVQFKVRAVASLFASFKTSDVESEAVMASGALLAVGVKFSVFLQPKKIIMQHAAKNIFNLFTQESFLFVDNGMHIAIIFKISTPGFV